MKESIKSERRERVSEGQLVELARRTISETNRILKIPNGDYVKEYGMEVDRVDRSKIEKCQTMLESLEFFMNTGKEGEHGE